MTSCKSHHKSTSCWNEQSENTRMETETESSDKDQYEFLCWTKLVYVA